MKLMTTLFLLHWYAAKKEKISVAENDCLEKFSYQTRPDSEEFCKQLVKFQPALQQTLSAETENQYWFPYSRKKDPIVSAMLKMLDDIDEKFCDVKNLWERLKSGAISFHNLFLKFEI